MKAVTMLIRSPVLMKRLLLAAILFFALNLLSPFVVAEDDISDLSLDEALQNLKKEVLELNRDIFILKEDLLFPANTQVAVFLSVDVGKWFKLDSVVIEIDGRRVASHLYTEKQIDALVRGGIQRVFLGNVKNGEHEITAIYTGKDKHERDVRRAASLTFNKNEKATYLELKIIDAQKSMQPEFTITARE